MRILTMTCSDRNIEVSVISDGDERRWQDSLTKDESLWVAAQFLSGIVSGYLKTAAEHEIWRREFLGSSSDEPLTI